MDERSAGSRDIVLRDMRIDDLPILFEQQVAEEANYMAAFVAENPADRRPTWHTGSGFWRTTTSSKRRS
jgi:hypothetical protein